MKSATEDQTLNLRVIVVASSIEGIDALARLINQLPANFPIPVVAQLHGVQNGSMDRLTAAKRRFLALPNVIYARHGEVLRAGCIYLILPDERLVFIAAGILGDTTDMILSSVDGLFDSAAHWYHSGVIGLVLSGLGTDGTQGLRAIAEADGIRVVQIPYEATFPSMPLSALIGDDVQYAVMIDQMGDLLTHLIADPATVEGDASEGDALVAHQVLAVEANLTKSLDRSINDILRVIREDLAMDVTFVTQQAGDDSLITHSTSESGGVRLQGMSHPRHQSLCQRVLDGQLPAVMPDVEALRSTHDVPVATVAVGAYMATPVRLRDGTLYGMLCCLNAAVTRDMDQRQYQRLQMSAQQIARLVNHAWEV